jgi:hypothetical protein
MRAPAGRCRPAAKVGAVSPTSASCGLKVLDRTLLVLVIAFLVSVAAAAGVHEWQLAAAGLG